MALPVLRHSSTSYTFRDSLDTYGISSGRQHMDVPYSLVEVIGGETIRTLYTAHVRIMASAAPVSPRSINPTTVVVTDRVSSSFENLFVRTSRDLLGGYNYYDDGVQSSGPPMHTLRGAVNTLYRENDAKRHLEVYAATVDAQGNLFALIGPGVQSYSYYGPQNDNFTYSRIFTNSDTTGSRTFPADPIPAPPEPTIQNSQWGAYSCAFTLLRLRADRLSTEDAEVVELPELAALPTETDFAPVPGSDQITYFEGAGISKWFRTWYSSKARFQNLVATSAFFISHGGRTWLGFNQLPGYPLDSGLPAGTIPPQTYAPVLREVTNGIVGEKIPLAAGHTVTFEGTPPAPFFFDESSGYNLETDFLVHDALLDTNQKWRTWGGTMTDAPVPAGAIPPYYPAIKSSAGFAWLVRNGVNQTVHMYTADMEFPNGEGGTFINGAYAGQLPWKPSQISGLTVVKGVFVVVVRDANGLWLGASVDGTNWDYIKKLADASELDTRQPNLWNDDLLAKPGEGLNVLVSDSAACVIKNVY